MKALVTGFDPFDGDSVNPSWEAVRRLPDTLGTLELTRLCLPTSFARAATVLDLALAADRFDVVLSVGLAGGRSDIAVERLAVNLIDARLPDNDGEQPRERPVVAGGPAGYFATLPAALAAGILRQAGLPAVTSLSAGSYVCNAIFYRLMHCAALDGAPGVAGFLHVPCLPGQAARRPGTPSMALDAIGRAVELVLAVAGEASLKSLTGTARS